jgi:hypothetical protein
MFDLVYELRRLRAGEADAAAVIRQHYTEKLITDKTTDFSKPNAWGAKFEGIAAAVDALTTNAVEPHDVERFIRSRMKWKKSEHYAEIGKDLPAPRGTNHYRNKIGKEPAGLQRQAEFVDDGKDRDNGGDDYLDIGGRKPQWNDPDADPDLVDALDMSEEEEAVIDLAQAGYVESGIASRLRMPESQVRRILNQLQDRAEQLGY